MNISAKADYAVRAMLQLAAAANPRVATPAKNGEGDPERPQQDVTLLACDHMAAAQELPRKFLETILTDLRRAGLVRSVRGAGGGYRLARPATEITIGAVIRAVDGPLAQVHGRRPHEMTYTAPAEHLPVVWVAVRAALRTVLDDITLDQLLTGHFPDHVRHLAAPPEAWANR